MTKATVKIKVNCGLKHICLYSVFFIRGIHPRFIFVHFALLVSKQINIWQIPMSHIISLLPRYYGGTSGRYRILSSIFQWQSRQTETDNVCNDSKTLQDHIEHVEQQSHGRTTHAKTTAIYLTILKNRASLLQAPKTF